MPRRRPAPTASSQLRRSIASAAARLMAEEGIGDYLSAKRKAARALGAGESETLPSNEEVEAELRAWQSLYQEDEQRERIQALRGAALEVMLALSDFHPYLKGAVLDGTAGRYSAAELDLFADSSKDVEIALLTNGIPFEIVPNRRQDADTVLRLEWNDQPVTLTIHPLAAERSQPRQAHPGRGRAKAEAVRELLRTEGK
jgi:hypothetical protein